jgi:rhodanese-related sulfurtransferase
LIKKFHHVSKGLYLQYVVLILLVATTASAHGTKDKQFISPADLASERAAHQILDLRSPENYFKSHVPGALSLPLQELSLQRLKVLGVKPGNPVILYSISETIASKGKVLLSVLGYSNVRILAGGFTHWLEDGQGVEAGLSQPVSGFISDEGGTGLEVVPEIYDFGKINKENGTVSTSFTVKNITDSEILITEITTSCGCTTAEIEAKLIEPGTAQTLTVIFDPNFHKEPDGKFSRTVFLQTSDNQEVQAKIAVEIVE